MSNFIDGPAKGKSLMHSRAPMILRVVRDNRGKFDVLDQLDDEASDDEEIFVYIALPNTFTSYHVSRRPRSNSGWYQGNDYKLFEIQPPEEVLRDNVKWGEWCESVRDLVQEQHHQRKE